MRTPFGSECPYFYGNYYRGNNHEECRLLGNKDKRWNSILCKSCQVPKIAAANSCSNMKLSARINELPFGLKKWMAIEAFCSYSNSIVVEPYVGCGKCHQILNVFLDKE